MKLRSLQFIILFLSVAIQANAQKRVLIQGSLKNATAESIILTTRNMVDNKEYQVTKTNVDSSGFFIIVVDCKSAKPYSLKYKGQELPIYLEPGDSLWLKGDATKLRNTAVFEGRGSKANKFLLEYNKKYFFDGTLANFIIKASRERNSLNFIWATDSLRESMLTFYTDYYDETLKSEFDNWIRNEIRCNMAWTKWDHILYNYPFVLENNGYDIDSSDYKLSHEIRIFNPTALNNSAYIGLLVHYHIELMKSLTQNNTNIKKGEDPIPDVTGVCEFLRDEVDVAPAIQFTAVSRFLAKCAESRILPKEVQLQLAYLKALQPDTAYTNPIDRLLQDQSVYFLKDLNISDTLARKFKPEMFNGKPVYVKYWATWNKASMQELTQCIALEERMKKSGISFIYVNMDPEVSVWYEYLAERNLKGNHYRYEDMEPGNLWDLYLKFKYSSHNQIYAADGMLLDAWAQPASSGAEKRLNELK